MQHRTHCRSLDHWDFAPALRAAHRRPLTENRRLLLSRIGFSGLRETCGSRLIFVNQVRLRDADNVWFSVTINSTTLRALGAAYRQNWLAFSLTIEARKPSR